MITLALPLPAKRHRRLRLLGFATDVLGGVSDGLRAARRYKMLSDLSDAELKRRGLEREDIARAAVQSVPGFGG
jgi:hypothetical protein